MLWQVIRAALLDGGLLPSDLGGLQLHGTGTALGDPIEMGAAAAVLSGSTSGTVELNAAKSRYGHAETAAGAIGILQSIRTLAYRESQMLMHLRNVNPLVEAALIHAAKDQQTHGVILSADRKLQIYRPSGILQYQQCHSCLLLHDHDEQR